MRFVLLVISVCCVMTSSIGCGGHKHEDRSKQDAALIQTARVSPRDLVQEYEAFGTVNAVKKADIVSYTKGIISDVWVKNGQKVEKGEKLLSLEGFYKIRDQEANQLDSADNNNNVKRSPIDGYVSFLIKFSGNKVDEGETLLSVVDLKNLIVRADVFANSATLEAGQKVKIIVGNKAIAGAVASVAFDVNPQTGGRAVEIQMTQQEPPEILEGEFVKVLFTSEHNNVLSIPESALLNENGNAVVVMKIKDGYEKRQITTGILSKGYFEVLSGLKENEIVVTLGSYEVLNQDINKKIKIMD